jgi:peptide-methionine (S)-S-oxide reductase
MRAQRRILIVALVLAGAYTWLSGASVGLGSSPSPQAGAAAAARKGQAVATFAAGCFWCTEADFDKVPGVVSTTSGYTGGMLGNPTYKQVTTGLTGHAEAVEIVYDPAVITYEKLLDHFWKNVDPFVADRQFCDRGNQYRPEIFVHDKAQRAAAEASKARIQQRFTGKPIVVAISDAGPFYRAEDYHQDYYKKNSAQYRFYRFGCRRDARLAEIWGESE